MTILFSESEMESQRRKKAPFPMKLVHFPLLASSLSSPQGLCTVCASHVCVSSLRLLWTEPPGAWDPHWNAIWAKCLAQHTRASSCQQTPTSQRTRLLLASVSVKPTEKRAFPSWRKPPLRDKVFQSLDYMGSTFVKRVCTGLNFTIISVFVDMTAIPASGLFRLAGSRVVFSTGISQLLKI